MEYSFSLSFFLCSTFVFAEDITITTYYPSPHGSYNYLQADKLGVGDNNGSGTLTSADVPTTSGDVWIKGKVGIGEISPYNKLEVRQSSSGTGFSGSSGTGGVRVSWSTGYGIGIDAWDGGAPRWGILKYSADTPTVMIEGMYNSNNVIFNNGGNVGIGTTAPVGKLQIASTNTDRIIIGNSAVDYNTNSPKLSLWGYSANPTTQITGPSLQKINTGGYGRGRLAFFQHGGADYTSETEVMSIDYSGSVGIGTTSPTYQLQLSTDSAAKPSTNTWTIASDARIKKDIRPYTNGLSIIKRINPVWFKYNGKAGFPEDNQEHIGVIAQEIVKVAPYTVNTFKAKLNPQDKEEARLLNFNSHALTFDLINAVKELDSNITKLSQENQALKKDNQELRSEMESLKTRLKM